MLQVNYTLNGGAVVKKIMCEVNFVRSAACVSVVMMHCMLFFRNNVHVQHVGLYELIRLLFCYATPTFIVLSEVLLSKFYRDQIPKGFFKKRLSYIVLPFFFFAFVNEGLNVFVDGESFDGARLAKYLSGRYEGWFVTVIVQFYFIHAAIVKLKVKSSWVLMWCVVISYFHYKYIAYILEPHQYKFFATSWLLYFCFGYFVGRHYERVLLAVRDKISVIFICVAIFVSFLSYNHYFISGGVVHSKLIELFPLVSLLFLVFLHVGKRVGDNVVINLISRFSYGVYLMHWVVLSVVFHYVNFENLNLIVAFFMLFFSTLITSMFLVKIIAMMPYGQYFVGKDNNNRGRTESICYSEQSSSKTL